MSIVEWSRVDDVLLDMDGTLLDLHYDNHFWLEHMPRCYAQAFDMPLEQASSLLMRRYQAKRGSLDWYCIDYWSDALGLDIRQLKEQVNHLIAVHPHVLDFLLGLRKAGKRLSLVTNAHQHVLAVKMQHTQLAGFFDHVLSAHDFGLPKEDRAFWPALRAQIGFERERSLFVDDSLAVLDSARDYGMGQLLMITRPDSQQGVIDNAGYPAVEDFSELLASLP